MFAAPRSELLALLAAIKAEPEENTPKLALADWLQEQPDEADRARSDFLYRFVQNNLLAKADPARQDFGGLIRLWDAHGTAWAGKLKSVGFTVWATNHMFRWGLLFPALDVAQTDFTRAAAVASSEEYAWVAGIAFRATDPATSPKLAGSPLLDSLIALRIGPAEGRTALLAELADSPRVAALQELDVGGPAVLNGYLRLAPLPALARSPHFTTLHRLVLREAQIAPNDLAVLCNSRSLSALRTLDLSRCELTVSAVHEFAESTGLPALVDVNLERVVVGDDGLAQLAANRHNGRLRRLNLAWCHVGELGVGALCAQPHMCNLTHLDLSGNRVSGRTVAELANAEHLKTLEELNLSANGVINDSAFALARSPYLVNLRRLDLTRNRFGAKAAAALRDRFGAAVLLR